MNKLVAVLSRSRSLQHIITLFHCTRLFFWAETEIDPDIFCVWRKNTDGFNKNVNFLQSSRLKSKKAALTSHYCCDQAWIRPRARLALKWTRLRRG